MHRSVVKDLQWAFYTKCTRPSAVGVSRPTTLSGHIIYDWLISALILSLVAGSCTSHYHNTPANYRDICMRLSMIYKCCKHFYWSPSLAARMAGMELPTRSCYITDNIYLVSIIAGHRYNRCALWHIMPKQTPHCCVGLCCGGVYMWFTLLLKKQDVNKIYQELLCRYMNYIITFQVVGVAGT